MMAMMLLMLETVVMTSMVVMIMTVRMRRPLEGGGP